MNTNVTRWTTFAAATFLPCALLASPPYSVPTPVWDQGYEADTAGWLDQNDAWYGSIDQVLSGTDGITSAAGDYHAIVEGDADSAPFSRFDGYRDTWPGTWVAEIDVYLDPAWPAGTGLDYSVASSGSDGAHQRDFIFHVTSDTSTGQLLVAGSNNTNFVPREDLENINHYAVTTAGWYTLQHVFYDNSGVLAVDLNLLDADGNALFTETRSDAADTIPAEVGGNRYAWFTYVNVPGGVPVDNHQLILSLSAYESKTSAADAIGALIPTGDDKTDKRLEKALEHLQKSLDPELWLDDSHLADKGKKVFDEEEKAVKELSKVDLLDVSSIVAAIVGADRALATTAIDEVDCGGDAKCEKELAKAEEELAKAEEEVVDGKADKAVEHFKKAWEKAQKAADKAVVDV
jgi:hypothetical protein